MSFLIDLESYSVQQETWPSEGRLILSQYTDESIIVYQTTEQNSIAENIDKYATINGTATPFKTDVKENYLNDVGSSYQGKRGTEIAKRRSIDLPILSLRIETSFVRAMYNCGWGKAFGQGCVLATLMTRDGFEEILRNHIKDTKSEEPTGDISIEWKADRSPMGYILNRFVPEFTIQGTLLKNFYSKWILGVKDITKYVDHQRKFIESGQVERTWTPKETVYVSDLSEQCAALEKETSLDNDENDDLKRDRCENLDITLADSSDFWRQVNDPREAILYLYGALNPIHSGHINALLESKKWLETQGRYTVCATRIVLASDSNIKQKNISSGDLCIKFEHRLKLCEIACKNNDFIQVCLHPFNSQSTAGEEIRKEINKPDATLVPLMGSDHAYLTKRRLKSYRGANKFVLCVGRKDMSKAELKAFEKAEKIRPTNSYDFFVVPTEFNEISSTKVRQKLSQMKNNRSQSKNYSLYNSLIIKELIDLGWIMKNEGDYICENIDTLFF